MINYKKCQFQWPGILGRVSAAGRVLGLWVRLSPEAWFLSVVIVVCDLERWVMSCEQHLQHLQHLAPALYKVIPE